MNITITIKETTFNRLALLKDYYKIYSIEEIINILAVMDLRAIGLSRRQRRRK